LDSKNALKYEETPFMYLICFRTLDLQVEGSIALRQDAEAFGRAKQIFAGPPSMFGQAVVGVSY
jgi:hypothetical protein